ncbi:MAG: hypothetical protein KDA84_18760, partial [Planctomycetaceae bacterium]|nr:hypothetical protein [Planctomycetaceae bacterium]
VGPFLKVETTRIIDSDSDGILEYKDPVASSTMPYVYYSSYDGRGYESKDFSDTTFGYGGAASGKPTFYLETSGSNPKAWNAQSYQIISAGADGLFGTGGVYDQGKSNSLPGANREKEADNITNFSGGTLQ